MARMTIRWEITIGNIISMAVIAGSFVFWATGLETRLAVRDARTDLIFQNMKEDFSDHKETTSNIIKRLADDVRYLARKEGKKD